MLLSPGKPSANIARAIRLAQAHRPWDLVLAFTCPSCQTSELCRNKMFLEQEQVCSANLSKHSTRKQERWARL